jgi:hypothetical protein
MKKSAALHIMIMSALIAVFVLLWATDVRAREPLNQQQCDQAGVQ